uniref:Secreted protein n=1 Tax=Globodera pallida TaxID=36090 RepID=A0A183BKW0_GLOPA
MHQHYQLHLQLHEVELQLGGALAPAMILLTRPFLLALVAGRGKARRGSASADVTGSVLPPVSRGGRRRGRRCRW